MRLVWRLILWPQRSHRAELARAQDIVANMSAVTADGGSAVRGTERRVAATASASLPPTGEDRLCLDSRGPGPRVVGNRPLA